MRELEFIDIIKNKLSKNSFIGDDCAYLKDLGIVVTHDSLVEDIHFTRQFSSPYEIGYKAIMVNLSDVYASGAVPKYLTISLSMPYDIDNSFVEDFYRAADDLSKEFDFEIIGGDITGGQRCFISICAIGVTKGRNIASRSNAKIGDYVVTTGNHGSSAAGLWLLCNYAKNDPGVKAYSSLINVHLCPVAQDKFSSVISSTVQGDYAMMDTSDGLVDALFKVAQSSNVLISVDCDKIPYDENLIDVAKLANVDYKNWIFYGGEDFQLVACVNEKFVDKLKSEGLKVIGKVLPKEGKYFVELAMDNKVEKIYDLENTYNHFGR